MRLLLDTHALLWWLEADGRLSPKVIEVLRDPTNIIYVCAAEC